MTTITCLKGDATCPQASGPRVVAHVCNDLGRWGKGFVLAVSRRWPVAEAEYRRWYAAGRAGGFALGAVQFVPVERFVTVANLVAQRGVKWGSGGPPIRYDALPTCLGLLARHAIEAGASVHMPRIGCGLAGGSWDVVGPLVDEHLCGVGLRVTVYDFD